LPNFLKTKDRRRNMPKFLILWQLDWPRTPEDPSARTNLWKGMLQGVQQLMATGRTTGWGAFPGGEHGYALGEGSVEEIAADLLAFVPFAKFDVRPAVSLEDMMAIIDPPTSRT